MKIIKKYNNFSLYFEKRNFILGIGLILLGVFMPVIINTTNFEVYKYLKLSLERMSEADLIMGAIRLVLLNGIRGLPHYLGTFLIIESIDIKHKDKRIRIFKIIITFIIIPLVYSLINKFHGIKYDLGVPAFIVIFTITYLETMDYSEVSFFKKSIILTLMLLGAQWLDVIPVLSKFGFGRGETSTDIKMISEILEGDEILTVLSTLFFLLFTVNSLMIVKLISDENEIIIANEKNKKVERELNEAKMRALESRYYVELKHLVHDLKTPLTSAQALVTMVGMMEEDEKLKSYIAEVENSIDNLSNMISEILYKEKRNIIKTNDLFNYTFSQISSLELSSNIVYVNIAKDEYINVNKIRLSRAIINAIDNSYKALKNKKDKISIYVYCKKDNVIIEISDEGVGIEKKDMEKLSEIGFSRTESTGLGFSFIEDVINNNDGKLFIESKLGFGTTVQISLPRVV